MKLRLALYCIFNWKLNLNKKFDNYRNQKNKTKSQTFRRGCSLEIPMNSMLFALLFCFFLFSSLEIISNILCLSNRQHWFISRLDGASVTAGGFPPQNNNVLVVTTSSNQVYAFDVEAKQLGEWSMRHTFVLPRRYQEFPGEVIGLSFLPLSSPPSVIIYSARCCSLIWFFKSLHSNCLFCQFHQSSYTRNISKHHSHDFARIHFRYSLLPIPNDNSSAEILLMV